jgi:hypothetical protein
MKRLVPSACLSAILEAGIIWERVFCSIVFRLWKETGSPADGTHCRASTAFQACISIYHHPKSRHIYHQKWQEHNQ